MKKRFGKNFNRSKKGQVWVETVIYTLIAFVVIGGVLSFAKPKIEEMQDQSAIEQSIESLEKMDQIISEISSTTGNRREISLGVNKGSYLINSPENEITFNIETSYQYSEPGQTINQGNIEITNSQTGEQNSLNATLGYDDYNITWEGSNQQELLSSSTTDYQIFISNEGNQNSGKTQINFETA